MLERQAFSKGHMHKSQGFMTFVQLCAHCMSRHSATDTTQAEPIQDCGPVTQVAEGMPQCPRRPIINAGLGGGSRAPNMMGRFAQPKLNQLATNLMAPQVLRSGKAAPKAAALTTQTKWPPATKRYKLYTISSPSPGDTTYSSSLAHHAPACLPLCSKEQMCGVFEQLHDVTGLHCRCGLQSV